MNCPKRVGEAFRRINTFWTILLPLRYKTLPSSLFSHIFSFPSLNLLPTTLPCFLHLNRNPSPSSFSFTNREIERDDETEKRDRSRERDSRWRRATRGSKVFILQGADRIRGLKLGGYGCWATDVVSG
jgi:hypothetical protein